MTPYPLTLQLGMRRLHGHVFLAPGRMYFICSKIGGAWAAAIGQSIGGLVGAAISAVGAKSAGDAPAAVTEETLREAVAKNEGSMIMEAPQIEIIKYTMWWRLIRWNGKKFGMPNGLDKPLKAALAEWTKMNNVRTKGLG